MPRLIVESDAPAASDFRFQHDTTDLLALLSFGSAARFGAAHPLAQLVRRLTERGLSLEPLLTFYDRNVEDAVDAANLAAAWQEPVPLRDCAAATRATIAADAATLTLWHDFPLLPSLLAELAGFASVAAGDGARIRMTFVLD